MTVGERFPGWWRWRESNPRPGGFLMFTDSYQILLKRRQSLVLRELCRLEYLLIHTKYYDQLPGES